MSVLLLAGCQSTLPRNTDDQIVDDPVVVDPHDYQAFYLWPGVKPPTHFNPKLLYLLDGEVRRAPPARFIRLRWGIPHLPHTPLWLVVRADRLDWGDDIFTTLFVELERWHGEGSEVVGLQVDFDAATRGIGGYRAFLTKLRARLPRQWRLSITGLLDWSAHGDPRELIALRDTVDEVVLQTYQDRTTISGYDAYFKRMRDFPVPFRIALVQGGSWTSPPMLARESTFRGYVVYLRGSRGRR